MSRVINKIYAFYIIYYINKPIITYLNKKFAIEKVI